MKKLLNKYNPGDGGQTLVEFALILLLILVVLFGITEFGRAWNYTNALNNGVRTGVRYATTLDNNTGFENRVRSRTMSSITSVIPNNNLSVNVYVGGSPYTFSNLSSGAYVTVEATMDFDFVTGVMDLIFADDGQNTLSRQATMRYQ